MRLPFDRPISQRRRQDAGTLLLSGLAWRKFLAEAAMRFIQQACLTLLLTVLALPALADTIDFRHLPDVPGAGGEISGGEFAGQGLQLTLLGGVSFNVGCGTIVSCLGADRAAADDFEGSFRGAFVTPDTGAPMSVLSFEIHFCCSTLKP